MADPSELSISTSRVGDVVVSPVGAVDMATGPSLQVYLDEALDKVLGDSRPALVLDLSGVDFLGSVGVAAVTTARHMPVHYAVVVSGPAERPLRLMAIDSLVDVYSSIDEAVAALGGASGV